MTILTLDQSNDLKEIVLNYLQGEAIDVVRVRLQSKCSELHTDCKTLFKSINLIDKDVGVNAILGSVNIKQDDKTQTYQKLLAKSKNLYDLLTHVFHNGNHHVGGLLKLIENTKRPRKWTLIFLSGTFLSAGVGFLAYFKKEYIEAVLDWVNNAFPFALRWLERTFALLRNFSLMGIITNSLSLAGSWYNIFSNGTISTAQKLDKLFFRTLTALFTISAYTLSYFAEGAMAGPAAFLFVIGSSIDFFKSLYTLFKSHHALKTLPIPEKDSKWEVLAEYERAKNNHERLFHSVWIKLGVAILTTIAVAVWCFFPPSLILTICCFSFITLIGLTKKSMLANTDETYAQNLQTAIKKIDAPIDEAQQSALIRLSHQQQVLAAKEIELKDWDKDLRSRERKLESRTEGVELALSAVASGQSSPAIALQALQQGGRATKQAPPDSAPVVAARPGLSNNPFDSALESANDDEARADSALQGPRA